MGNIARLAPEKGHIFCLEAFKMVVNRFPKAKLIIVGDGILRPDIEAKIKELNLDENVIMSGYREDIPEILASLDISLHTSIWEGMPIAIIEAMLSAKPIIATRVGGIPELIEDGVSGLLVPALQAGALSASMERLINDKTLAANMGEVARARAKERFNSDVMMGSITNLYDSFINFKRLK